jgi:heat shock protein HtpX
MYSAIARNRRTTVVLIISYIAIIVGIGIGFSFLFNSIWPVIVLSILVGIHVVYAWFRGGAMVERAMNDHRVTARDEPRFFRAVDTLAIRNGMPMPKLAVDERDLTINAYAAGMRPDKAVVGITRGALNNLDNTELEALLSHEMSHIKNGDMRVKTLVTALVGFMQLVAIILIGVSVGVGTSGSGSNSGSAERDKNRAGLAVLGVVVLVLGFVFVIVGFIVGPIVRSAVSRQREYLADASGVEMTRFVPGMISLFRKMEYEEFGTTGVADSSALGMFYAYRRPRRGLAYLLNATHPPTYKRIERVASMERNF